MLPKFFAAAVDPKHRQTDQGEWHLPIPVEHLGCNKADQQATQRAAGGDAEIEVGEKIGFRLTARELTVAQDAPQEKSDRKHW